MKLTLSRFLFSDKSTIGALYINDVYECFTLEDVERSGPKVPGKTAIPTGTYKVVIDMSTRFKRLMPHILDVPNFTGIRIHPGNIAADTEGCILVGATQSEDFIGSSQKAFARFFEKLSAAILEKEDVTITVEDRRG